jgi:PAS domain S-box-containing protein
MAETPASAERILELTEAYGGVGYWQVDIETQSVFWSREVFRIHGVDPSEGEPPLEEAINFYHPDDVPMVQAAVDAASADGKPFQFYGARIVQKGGGIRRIFSHGEVTNGADGQPARISGVFRDITEEFERNEALKQTKSRVDLLVKSGVGIWEWDLKKDRVWASSKLAEILGLAPVDLDLPLAEFMSGMTDDVQAEIRQKLAAHIDDGTPYLVEHTANARDRGTIWLRSRGQAEFDSDGAPVRMVGWSEDITSLRRAESEQRMIFDSVPSMIWLKDDQNRILRLNRRAAETMGGTVEDFEGADTYELFGEMAKKYHEDDLAVIKAGEPHTGIIEAYTPVGGQAGWVQTDKIPMRSNSGRHDRILVVSTDITALRDAEQALRESDGRFQLAASGASVGIWDWVDTNGEEEIWSDIFYELIGYTRAELPASLAAFSGLLHPDDQERTFAAVDAHFTRREPFHIEYRLKHKRLGYRWFLGTGQASFDADGQPQRMVGSIQDIHDRKMAEEKLLETNQELERFAYIASHDLQEPLRKINQFSALLQGEYASELGGNGQVYLNFLMDASERMQQQIRDLLEYSRAGRAAVKLEAADVEATARKVWDDHSESLADIDASLTVSGEATICADRELLFRLMFNLIGNCIKYRSPDRPLEVHISAEAADGHDVLRIADNGIGFDPRHAETIFGIFNRLHRKEEYPGTGLGLALCERVLHLHGGTITAEGRPGEGAIFTAKFPQNADR